ncbi:MAG: DUF4932 domain-containing protein [Brevinematia bacterium]
MKNFIIFFLLVLSSKLFSAVNISSNISIGPDYRIELVGIVFALATQDEEYFKEEKYLMEMNKYFLPYKNHKAVVFVKEIISNRVEPLLQKGIPEARLRHQIELSVIAELYNIILNYSENNKLTSNSKDTKYFSRTELTKKVTNSIFTEEITYNIEEKKLINLLKDFIKVSKYENFYSNIVPVYYQPRVDEITNKIDIEKIVVNNERFFGENAKYTRIILSYIPNGYFAGLSQFSHSKGLIECNSPIILVRERSMYPLLSEELFYHELAHSFFNFVMFKNVDKDQFLEIFKRRIVEYSESINIAYEILRNNYDENTRKVLFRYYLLDNFISVKEFYELLEKYQGERDKYKTFNEFFKEIPEYFAKLSDNDIGYKLTVGNSLTMKIRYNEMEYKKGIAIFKVFSDIKSLQEGDIILKINGRDARERFAFHEEWSKSKEVLFEVLKKDGEIKKINLKPQDVEMICLKYSQKHNIFQAICVIKDKIYGNWYKTFD